MRAGGWASSRPEGTEAGTVAVTGWRQAVTQVTWVRARACGRQASLTGRPSPGFEFKRLSKTDLNA
jgi:hypothetical protein